MPLSFPKYIINGITLRQIRSTVSANISFYSLMLLQTSVYHRFFSDFLSGKKCCKLIYLFINLANLMGCDEVSSSSLLSSSTHSLVRFLSAGPSLSHSMEVKNSFSWLMSAKYFCAIRCRRASSPHHFSNAFAYQCCIRSSNDELSFFENTSFKEGIEPAK